MSNSAPYRIFAEHTGFNIITGQNSAGKTALLEAMTLQLEAKPHRTVTTVPFPGASPATASVVRLTLVLDREELLRIVDKVLAFRTKLTNPPNAGNCAN
jgi:recombinational DNA repair ATPase RecF